MHDKIKILDTENGTRNFRVVFEVPGKHYDQPYPKRLRHSFPKKEKWMEKIETDDGETVRRFEKYLYDNYVDDKKRREEASKVDEKIEKVREEVEGKELQK